MISDALLSSGKTFGLGKGGIVGLKILVAWLLFGREARAN
jgi:hypothetical protein